MQQLKWVDRREADEVDPFQSVKDGPGENKDGGNEDPGATDGNKGGGDVGALEILVDLIDMHPGLDMTPF